MKYLLFSFFFLPFSCLGQQDTNSEPLIPFLSQEETVSVHSLFREMPDSVQWSVGMLVKDSVMFFGLQKVDSSIQLLDNRLGIFEIGSISKVFTGALLAQAMDQQKLHSKNLPTDFLPFSFPFSDSITLLQLVNHSSGLPRIPGDFGFSLFSYNPYASYSKEALLNYLSKRVKLEHQPGETYLYSNLGVGLVGLVLESIAGLPYDSLLSSVITIPFGMPYTGVSLSRDLAPLLVPGRNAKGKRVENWEMGPFTAAGGIRSNTQDLTVFIRKNWVDTAFLALTHQETFVVNENLAIGMGWHLLKKQNQPTLYFHDGGTGGYTSALVFNKQEKTGVVILSNCTSFYPKSRNIAQAALEIINYLTP